MTNVLVEQRERVLVITLNRAEARNSLDDETTDALADALARLGSDDTLAVGVLTGAGKGFCAGLDLAALRTDGPPRQLRSLLRARAPKPLVCAIEGFALAGGFELALMSDLIVAAKGAKLALPETSRGLMPTGGGIFRLPQRLALEMLLTSDVLTAEDLYRHGMVNRLVEPGEALPAALALAEKIAGNGPLGIRHGRRLIYEAGAHSEDEMWERQMEARNLVFESNDAKEGATAFLEKREPRWTGT